jgi:AP endonuclease-1
MRDIPLILETPTFEATDIWTKEIVALNRLSNLDSEVPETELSLVNEIMSLVRSHAANKTEKASKTRARKEDATESHCA